MENGTFHRHFVATWGINHVPILEDGELLTLSLDDVSRSGFESKKEFLFGKIDMKIKLVLGNAAGTVSTYYVISEGKRPDKIDIELWGTQQAIHTHFTQMYSSMGKVKEWDNSFFLWFDPTLDFHAYSILWNPKCIIVYLDGVPIREFKNLERLGVPFPSRPMRLYSSKAWLSTELDGRSRARMERTRKGYMMYDYCRDKWRFIHS